MAKVREIAWPDEFSDLKRIEDSMVCGICYEYMDTSVMTPCSHNYCSMCIRKYLHYKQQCPACFHNVFEKDLYINRSMDVIIQHYLQLREKLISLIQNRIVYNSVMNEDEEPVRITPKRPVRNSPRPTSPVVQEKKSVEAQSTISPMPSTSKLNFSSPVSSRLSRTNLPSIAKIFSTPKRKEGVTQVSPVVKTDVPSVMCPVCSVDIPDTRINVHLDACLNRENTQKKIIKEKPAKPKRPPLPKLVLRVMKDAELKKKMKELGLPIQGDRRTLENRFTRYSVIYNSECDKLDPRPIPDLIRQCEMEEKQEQKLDRFLVSTSAANKLQIDKNAKEEKIDEAQKNYRVANKSSFDKLIEEVRKRRALEKAQLQQDSNEPGPSTSSEKTTEETTSNLKIKENISDKPSTELDLASDSEENFPLQHYQSDGPNKFCSVNLNDSGTSASNSPTKSQDRKLPQKQNKEKIPEVLNVSEAVYEVSTDDEIADSPESGSVSPERKIRQAAARDMCNSIINDFSFEDEFVDDSLTENKKQEKKEDTKNDKDKEVLKVDKAKEELEDEKEKEVLKVDEEKEKIKGGDEKEEDDDSDEEELVKRLMEINNSNLLKLKRNSSEELLSDVEEENEKSDDDFPLEILNGDSFDEFVNSSITASQILSHPIQNGIETIACLSSEVPEKENNALSAIDNSEKEQNEGLRRPMRKRNRPARFGVSNQQNEDESNSQPNDATETESSGDFKDIMQDGSLKRRRGRPKSNSQQNSPDEVQNPPKRPVRRRQTPMVS